MRDFVLSGHLFLLFGVLSLIAMVLGIVEKREPPARVVLNMTPFAALSFTIWGFMATHFENGVVLALVYVVEFAVFQFVMKPLLRRSCR